MKPVCWCPSPEIYKEISNKVNWQESPRITHMFYKSLSIEMQRETTPLCLVPLHYRYIERFGNLNWLYPMDQGFPPEILENISPSILTLVQRQGRLLGIPEDFSPYGLLARKEILEKADLEIPQTWEEMEEQGKKFSKDFGKPLLGLYGMTISSRVQFLLSLLGSNGVDFSKPLSFLTKETFRLIEAYNWLWKIGKSENLFDLNLLTNLFEINQCLDYFLEGILPYCFLGMNSEMLMKLNIDKDIILFPFPKNSSANPSYYFVGGRCWVIPHNSEFPQKGLEVLIKMSEINFIKKLNLITNSPFTPWMPLWNDRDIIQKFPLYRNLNSFLSRGIPLAPFQKDENILFLASTFARCINLGASGNEWVSRHLKLEKEIEANSSIHPVLKRALKYIGENYLTLKNSNEIAERVQLNSRYLNRLFKKEFQMSCTAWLKKKQMEWASDNLRRRTLTIKELAFKLGYKNTSSFNRAFQQQFGIPPSQYREKLEE